jgi:oligoribonuclease
VSDNDLMVWVDLETTGLDPNLDYILELGLRVTGWDGEEIERFTTLVAEPGWWEAYDRADPIVREMHTASGLFSALADNSEQAPLCDYREAESAALEWLREKVPQGLCLSGSSVHLDRWFLLTHMSRLASHFGYRLIDVSGIREAMALINPALYERIPEQVKAHRVQPDIDNSIGLWQFEVDNFLYM